MNPIRLPAILPPPGVVALACVALFGLAACGGGGGDTAVAGSGSTAVLPGGAGPATLPPLQVDSSQETVTCRNASIGALRLDTVFVPDDAACELFGTQLKGSIKVGTRAAVLAVDVAVTGDLQAEGAAAVIVQGGSTFGGSVQVKQGAGADIRDASIGGDLQFDAMSAALVAESIRIGGNLQAVGNRGGVALSNNHIDGNLQCKDNQPAPTGGGNTAASKEDQCAAL